jgi:hypothetical protein
LTEWSSSSNPSETGSVNSWRGTFGEILERGEIRGNSEEYLRKERNSEREVSTRTSFMALTFLDIVLLHNAKEEATAGIRK